jgi:hypothetical protein
MILTGFILVVTLWGNGNFVNLNTIRDYKDEAACTEAKTALMQLVDPGQPQQPHGIRAVCIPGPEVEKF